jgi:hypothetical protein
MRVTGAMLACCVLFGAVGAASDSGATQMERHRQRSPGRSADEASQAAQQQAVLHRPATAENGDPAPGRASLHHRTAVSASRGISCVPYARMVTGMAVTGDGWQWWGNAAGLYSRGQRPEPGSVLNFRSSGGMARGHVAVVSRVLGSRHVLIDHANWAGPGIRRGSVMRNVSVVDVSQDNDWTEVRVQVGHDPGTFGRTYPTYGFIYNRPDDSPAAGTAFAGLPLRRSMRLEQVAEMPAGGRPVPFADEVPSRQRAAPSRR